MNQFRQHRYRRSYLAQNKRLSWFWGRKTQVGFTLIELLAVIVIVGVLMGIMAPGWLGFLANNRLNAAQDGVFQAMRQAQLQATHRHEIWRVGFRETGGLVEWATYAASNSAETAGWQPLLPNVRIAPTESTISQSNKAYFVEFDHMGNVTPPLGRLSLASSQGGSKRRCVFVSTVLGALRKAADAECY